MKNHCVDALKIHLVGESILIEGPITQQTVMAALSQCTALMAASFVRQVNLQAVTDCDSAGLALLIALLRRSKLVHQPITFSNPPKQILDLSHVSGLNGILPVI